VDPVHPIDRIRHTSGRAEVLVTSVPANRVGRAHDGRDKGLESEQWVSTVVAFSIAGILVALGVIVGATRWAMQDGSPRERRQRAAVDRELRELLDSDDRP